MKNNYTPMRINEIRDDTTVYVKNLTKTDVNITVMDNNGKPLLLVIPRSPIPQDITEIATSDILRKDINFKKMISNGAIHLVPNEYAEHILNTPEGQVHQARLKKTKTLPSELIADDNDISLSPLDVVGTSTYEIRGKLRDLVLDENASSEDIYADVLMLDSEEELSQDEIDFLLSSLNDHHFDVLEFLKGKRNSLLNDLSNKSKNKTNKKKK